MDIDNKIEFSGNIKSVKDTKFCDSYIIRQIEFENVYSRPKEVKPTEGKHDYKQCTGCQASLKNIEEMLTQKFNGDKDNKPFPECCDLHKELLNDPRFNRNDFINVPKMVAEKVVFSHQHIYNKIESDNYLKEIGDYLSYIVRSFGEMPSNCGEPLFLGAYLQKVEESIDRIGGIPEDRANKVKNLIQGYREPSKEVQNDIGLLIKTYEKWVKTIPFELSCFQPYERKFKNTFPLFDSVISLNEYTGYATAKIATNEQLVNRLNYITLDLINKVNVIEISKSFNLSEMSKETIKLAEATLRTELNKLSNQYTRTELRYVKALKKWLKANESYFSTVSQAMKNIDEPQVEKMEKLKGKEELLFDAFEQHGLFSLPKLEGKDKLRVVKLICSRSIPYSVAMLNYLGVFDHLMNNYGYSKLKTCKTASKWFSSDKDGRSIKGNLNTLSEKSNENNNKYTAHLHKETVIKDYESLK